MSGSIDDIIAHPVIINPLDNLAKWQAVNQSQAQTQQIGAQTQGIDIANQLAGLNVARRSYLQGVIGVPNPGGAAGSVMGSPQAGGGTPGTAGGMPAGGGGMPGGGAGGSAPVNSTAAAQSGGTSYPGALGESQFGIPMPPLTALNVALSDNQPAALKEALEGIRQTKQALFSVPPAQFPAALQQAIASGLINPSMAQAALSNPNGQALILRTLQDPAQYASLAMEQAKLGLKTDPNTAALVPDATAIGVKGAVAQTEAAGKGQGELANAEALAGANTRGAGQYTPATYTADSGEKDENGQPIFKTYNTNRNQAAGLGSPPAARTADMMGPASTGDFAGRVIQAESGGKVSSTSGVPGQTASGVGSFTDGTWKSFMQAVHPAMIAGLSDADIAALKVNPAVGGQLGKEATTWYAGQNAAGLAQAGLPVNAQTLGMAHHFGPDGAQKILNAPPNTPMASLFPAQLIANNPDVKGLTTSQYAGQAAGIYGTGPVLGLTPGTKPAVPAAPGATPPPPGATPAASPGAAPPVVGAAPSAPSAPGAVPGAAPGAAPPPGLAGPPTLSAEQLPGQAARVAETEAIGKAYGQQAASIVQAGTNAPNVLGRLDVLENAAQNFRPGASADVRLSTAKAAADALQTFGISVPQGWADNVAAGETISKEAGFLTAEMTKSLGSREAASVFQSIAGIQPNIKMSEGGFPIIVASIRSGAQRDQDLLAYQEKWLAPPTQGGLGNTTTRGMQASFNKAYPVETYASRVVPFPLPKSLSATNTSDLIPNVVYSTPKGQGIWTGQGFKPVGGQ